MRIICRHLAVAALLGLGSLPAQADSTIDRLGDLRLDEVQIIATHNSYHLAPEWPIMALLQTGTFQSGTPWPGPRLARALDHSHLPLDVQLALGLRAIELDVHDDPEGGRFAGPGAVLSARARGWPLARPTGWLAAMQQPGFKVFHHEGYDQGSHCWRLAECLAAVRDWSERHPGHAPITVFIETKPGNAAPLTPDYPAAAPRVFDAAAWRRLEGELIAAIGAERLFTPAQLAQSPGGRWPTLRALQGKVLVMLLDSEDAARDYTAAIEGTGILFTAERPSRKQALRFSGEPWAVLPDPRDPRIASAARRGLITFTRADADTEEARSNDTARREAAFASGTTFISTDYPFPDKRLSDYAVAFPGGDYVRCNPVRAACGAAAQGAARK